MVLPYTICTLILHGPIILLCIGIYAPNARAHGLIIYWICALIAWAHTGFIYWILTLTAWAHNHFIHWIYDLIAWAHVQSYTGYMIYCMGPWYHFILDVCSYWMGPCQNIYWLTISEGAHGVPIY